MGASLAGFDTQSYASPNPTLEYPDEPSLELRKRRMVGFRRGTGRILLNHLHPGLHLVRRQRVSLPSNGQYTLQYRDAVPEQETSSQARTDISLPLPLHLGSAQGLCNKPRHLGRREDISLALSGLTLLHS
jgi:hypothetical protein